MSLAIIAMSMKNRYHSRGNCDAMGRYRSSPGMAVQAEIRLAWIGAQLDALYTWRARLETELARSARRKRIDAEAVQALRASIAQADADIAYTWQRQKETERARRPALLIPA